MPLNKESKSNQPVLININGRDNVYTHILFCLLLSMANLADTSFQRIRTRDFAKFIAMLNRKSIVTNAQQHSLVKITKL